MSLVVTKPSGIFASFFKRFKVGTAKMSEHESAMDYEEHKSTYAAFIKISQWGTAGIIVLLILMAIFLL